MTNAAHVQGWQDISTAPKDGTRVILWHALYSQPLAAQFYGEWWGFDFELGPLKYQPSHWQPLPPPPGQEQPQPDLEAQVRELREALEEVVDCVSYTRHGGATPEDLESYETGLNRAVDIAHNALIKTATLAKTGGA